MKFFRENFDNIIKLFIYQIGTAIFSFFLYSAAGSMSSDGSTPLSVKVALSAFSTLFYFVLIYTLLWEAGAKDKIRIDGKRAEKEPFKGILTAFFANGLNFVLTAVATLLMGLFMATAQGAFRSAFLILNLFMRFLLSVYLGMVQGMFISLEADVNLYYLFQSVGFFAFPILAVLFAHFAYSMGLRERRMFGFLSTKK